MHTWDDLAISGVAAGAERGTRRALARVLCCVLMVSTLAAGAEDFESPPMLQAKDIAPRGVLLQGPRYRVDDAVPTDGFLASFTIRSDFGTIEARGPGVLRMRLGEVAALAELEKMENSEVFLDALKRSASSLGSAVVNVVTNPVEVAKGIPAGVGRFFGRVARDTKTAAQKLGDIKEGREAGAPRGAEAATNPPNLAVAGGVATGRAVRDILGYDEQRRHLAKTLGVDPYTTNPVLKKRLEDVAWAAFAGGLGIDVLASKIPGGTLVKSTSVLSDWVYDKPPGDLRVWIEKCLRDMGVNQETVDLFLRQRYWTLTTQTALVLALEELKEVEGRGDVLDTAVTVESEDQARYLALGFSLLAREHKATPLKAIIGGKPIGMTRDGRVVVTAPVDYICWTEEVAAFAAREDLLANRPTAVITGQFSPRARAQLTRVGWKMRENVPLAGAL